MDNPNDFQHCILMGNPHNGFVVIGPFECIQDARRYIETDPEKSDMWVVEMNAPASDEEGEPPNG